jgi:acyl dehydratase
VPDKPLRRSCDIYAWNSGGLRLQKPERNGMAGVGTVRTTRRLSVEDFRSMVGTMVGMSSWHRLGQAEINRFAEITSDLQYIHVDEARAKESPFGGTIAHGMLSLSMISAMFYEAVPPVEGASASLNYGFDKVRFLSPVPSGSEISGSFTLSGLDARGDGRHLFRYGVTMQVRGASRPAIHADWLVMHILTQIEGDRIG